MRAPLIICFIGLIAKTKKEPKPVGKRWNNVETKEAMKYSHRPPAVCVFLIFRWCQNGWHKKTDKPDERRTVTMVTVAGGIPGGMAIAYCVWSSISFSLLFIKSVILSRKDVEISPSFDSRSICDRNVIKHFYPRGKKTWRKWFIFLFGGVS